MWRKLVVQTILSRYMSQYLGRLNFEEMILARGGEPGSMVLGHPYIHQDQHHDILWRLQGPQEAAKPGLQTQVGQLLSGVRQERQTQHPHQPDRGVVGDCPVQDFSLDCLIIPVIILRVSMTSLPITCLCLWNTITHTFFIAVLYDSVIIYYKSVLHIFVLILLSLGMQNI